MSMIDKLHSVVDLLLSGITMLLLAGGCVDPSSMEEPASPVGEASLSFRVADRKTRLGYDGELGTRFENGDKVGCVMAQKLPYGGYVFLANTLYHYNDGVLVLDSLALRDNSGTYRYIHFLDDRNTLITRKNPSSEDGLLRLMLPESVDYSFFFYYPYVATHHVYDDLREAMKNFSAEKPLYSLLKYPGYANNEGLEYPHRDPLNNRPYVLSDTPKSLNDFLGSFSFVGDIRDIQGYESGLRDFLWTGVPAFVNRVQRSKEQFENSDFLWISYTSDQRGNGNINRKTATYPVDLTFRKKTSTIEVSADISLENVFFKSPTGIELGTLLNLETGERSVYRTPDLGGPPSLNHKSLLPLYPRDMTGMKRKYRLMLPPQSSPEERNFQCDLFFTIDGKEHRIRLNDNFHFTEEGKLYTIHINRSGDHTFKIEDWAPGYTGGLVE